MTFERFWTMPCRYTFKIPYVRTLLLSTINPSEIWCDPFAGKCSPAHVRNDLDKDANADYHLDALEFLQSRADAEFDGILYDPPYSFRQAVECYKGNGRENFTSSVSNLKYWADCKNEAARIVKHGGLALCFGWNTNGLGVGRGFQIESVRILAHGGSKNDTLITVERKWK